MARSLACSVVAFTVVLVGATAYGQQYGGPSGPDDGEWVVGVESNWRCDVASLVSGPDPTGLPLFPLRRDLSIWTQQGSVEYGITDRLSVRGKIGVTRLELPREPFMIGTVPGADYVPAYFNYGLSWNVGLGYRICAPEERGTALALRGFYGQADPDDFTRLVGAIVYHDVDVTEWGGALLVGAAAGRVRPYAGVSYCDLELDMLSTDPTGDRAPMTIEKEEHVGAIVGLDWDLCETAFLNVEAHAFDESGVTTGLRFAW